MSSQVARTHAQDLIKSRKKELGSEGLQNLATLLEEANAKNDVPVPTDVIASISIPPHDSIKFFSITSLRNGELVHEVGDHHLSLMNHTIRHQNHKSCWNVRISRTLPCHHFSSNAIKQVALLLDLFHYSDSFTDASFVKLNMYIDTQSLSPRKRMYLELYLEIVFEVCDPSQLPLASVLHTHRCP